MKKKTYVLLGILAAGFMLFVFAGCAPGVDSLYNEENATAFATLGSADATAFDVKGLTTEAMDYRYDKEDTSKTVSVDGYKLSGIITADEVEAKAVAAPEGDDLRPIFSYDIYGDDGYNRGPVSWKYVGGSGYYLYDPAGTDGAFTYTDPDDSSTVEKDPRVAYDLSLDVISSGYYIKFPQTVKLFRSVSVTIGSGTPTLLHISAFTTEEVTWSYEKGGETTESTDNAVPLSNIVKYFEDTGALSDADTKTYQLRCFDYDAADDFTYEDLTYADLANAYFIFKVDADGYISDDKAVILDENNQANDGQKRPKYVTDIVVE